MKSTLTAQQQRLLKKSKASVRSVLNRPVTTNIGRQYLNQTALTHTKGQKKGKYMGNRAIITTMDKDIGIYVHWNGGLDSVTAFLKYCELRGFRGFPDEYGIARLTQVISNFFGGDLSIGVTAHPEHWINGCDNGAYIVDGWRIVEHLDMDEDGNYTPWHTDYHEGYDITEMVMDIDTCQPEQDRLGEEKIREAMK